MSDTTPQFPAELDQLSLPVMRMDELFPRTPTAPEPGRPSTVADVSPVVESILRDVLGWRPRVSDPAAFTGALTAAFRLETVEGHVEATFVPRGYAVQSDLGAVTGGQASLYRRAQLARTEALQIVDGLRSLRPDSDVEDVAATTLLVRESLVRVVDEMGAPGGPRVQLVDSFLASLTGVTQLSGRLTADDVAGHLGRLRDRLGLVEERVNTVEEEGVRTAFWTLVDLVGDLQASWDDHRARFTGDGNGFLGTELIALSRHMEAALDELDELEQVLDSVAVRVAERRTCVLADGLTLDGLLEWMRTVLGEYGRRVAQEAGRDGVVALVPSLTALYVTYRNVLADVLKDPSSGGYRFRVVVRSPTRLPAGLHASRAVVALVGLERVLRTVHTIAARVALDDTPVLVDVLVMELDTATGDEQWCTLAVRGLSIRPFHEPALSLGDRLVTAVPGSVTASEDAVAGRFSWREVAPVLEEHGLVGDSALPLLLPAKDVPIVLLDGRTGRPAPMSSLSHPPTPRAPRGAGGAPARD